MKSMKKTSFQKKRTPQSTLKTLKKRGRTKQPTAQVSDTSYSDQNSLVHEAQVALTFAVDPNFAYYSQEPELGFFWSISQEGRKRIRTAILQELAWSEVFAHTGDTQAAERLRSEHRAHYFFQPGRIPESFADQHVDVTRPMYLRV
jgi:hypothetical protein